MMNRRAFFGSAAAGCLVPVLPVFGFGEEVQSKFEPWWEVTSSRLHFGACSIVFYRWPQDRYIAFESEQPDGKKDELIVPTFSLAEIGTDLWTQIVRAIKDRSSGPSGRNAEYCAVIRIMGLQDEVGIVTCRYPMRPLVNPWARKVQNPRRTDWANRMEVLTLGSWKCIT